MSKSMFADLEKWEARKEGLAARRFLPRESINMFSKRITEKVMELPEVIAAKEVFCYAAMIDEVQTVDLMQALLDAGKNICIPLIRCRGSMEAVRVTSFDDLETGKYGILTVKPGREILVKAAEIDCAIIPGSAFGRDQSRVGMGGGFYDRFLLLTKKAKRVGVCFGCQLKDTVPVERHDLFMDVIVTESELIKK